MNLPTGPATRSTVTDAGEVRVSCAVMAHPRRAAAATALAASLPELGATVVLDPNPDGPPATLRTAAEAWAAVPDGATHHVVLQDDATPCAGFAEALQGLLGLRPDLPISLHTEWGSGSATMVRWAALSGGGLVRCVDEYVPTVGLVLPARLARELGEFARTWPDRELPDDVAVARFLAEKGVPPYVASPNLVEHDGDLSLVGNGGPMGIRRSPCLRLPGDGPQRADLLEAPGLVPIISAPKARAVGMCWDTAGQRHAGYTTLRPELERAGVAHQDVVAALDKWLASAAGDRLEAALGYGFLHETWVAAVALAVFAPGRAGADPVAGLGLRALETVAPGGLRTLVPATVSGTSLRADLAALVRDGFALRGA